MRAVMGRKLLSLGEDEVRALMKNNRLQCDFFSSIRQPIKTSAHHQKKRCEGYADEG
jgi:hypothetical protein